MYSIQRTVFGKQYTVHSALSSVYRIQFSVHEVILTFIRGQQGCVDTLVVGVQTRWAGPGGHSVLLRCGKLASGHPYI